MNEWPESSQDAFNRQPTSPLKKSVKCMENSYENVNVEIRI